MVTNTRTVKASCLCGKAKHELTLPNSAFPLQCGWCHCSSCRHMAGTLCLNVASTPDDYEPPKELFDELTAFQFSKRYTQFFCKTCGSQMISRLTHAADNSRGAHWDIMTGTLEKADGVFELEEHYFIADTIDGGFSDFLPSVKGKEINRWPLNPNHGKQLPRNWQSETRPKVTPHPNDRLYCHCKCGGVKFWIARPSERSKNAASQWPDLIIPYHSPELRPENPEYPEWWLRENGTKFLAGNCSCNSCRLDTGMEFVNWCFIPTVDISLDDEGEEPYSGPFGTLKAYESSENVTRYHCGVCGASVFFTTTDRRDLVDVAVGLLDAPEGSRAESWLDWRLKRLSFREDSMPRAETLTLALEEGQNAWAMKYGKVFEDSS